MKSDRLSSAILALCCSFAAIPAMGTAQVGCATNAEAIEGEVLIITPDGRFCTASDEERVEFDRATAAQYADLAAQQDVYVRAMAAHRQAVAAQEAAAATAKRAAQEAEKAAAIARAAAKSAPGPAPAGARMPDQKPSEAAQQQALCMGQPGNTAAMCKGRAIALQQQAARR